jgi:hypothetical protein
MAWPFAKIQTIPRGIMKEIAIPRKLAPLVQAFSACTKKETKALLVQAARAIYCRPEEEGLEFEFGKPSHVITKDELETIISLMNGINPKDTLEALYAAQIVASHMLGMRKLADAGLADQHLGLKLLRFSMDSMRQLERKRMGAVTQTVTVNYNYNGQGNALMQTIIPDQVR